MLIHNPIFTGSISLNGTDISQISTVSTDSSSFALRITNNESTSSAYVLSSGSFSTRTTNSENYIAALNARTGSFATTGSNQFNGNQTVTGSLTATGTIIAQTLVVQTVTSSVVYSSGSNIFGLNSGNSHQFTGSVLVSGSVGIGTTSPSYKLDVTAASGENYIRVSSAADQDGGFRIAEAGTNKWLLYNVAASDAFAIYDNTAVAERLRIASDGSSTFTFNNNSNGIVYSRNVSGTIYELGSIKNSGSDILYQGTGNVFINADSNSDSTAADREVKLGNRGVAYMTLTSTGNVGIGTTSPSGVLNIKGANDANLILLENTTGGTSAKFQISENNGLYITSYESTSGRLISFSTQANGAESMRITSGGNVGIGLTNPQTQFHINGVMTFSEAGYDTVRLHKIEHGHSDGNSANNNIRFLVSDGSGTTAERMRINGAGQIITYSGQTGGYIRVDSGYVNETQTITTNATSYFLYKYTGGANGSSTTYFNLTGVSTANGTWLDVVMRARKDATGSAINTSMYLQINGSNIEYNVANGTAAVQVDRKLRIVRMSDEWIVLSVYVS